MTTWTFLTVVLLAFVLSAFSYGSGHRLGRARQLRLDNLRMRSLCEEVDRFADSELDEHVADQFRRHLSQCSPCRSELRLTMLLKARLAELGEGKQCGAGKSGVLRQGNADESLPPRKA